MFDRAYKLADQLLAKLDRVIALLEQIASKDKVS